MEDMTIRPARPDDLPAIKELNWATLRDHALRQPDHFSDEMGALIARLLEAAVLGKKLPDFDSDSYVYVCELEAQPVGYAMVTMGQVFAGPSRKDLQAILWDIAILPEARRKNNAFRLVSACMERARRDGATLFKATVWQGNDASEALLAKAGLSPVRREFEARFLPPWPYQAPKRFVARGILLVLLTGSALLAYLTR
jgi:ribosomal protein S18 acetylase RimI-like enzyme